LLQTCYKLVTNLLQTCYKLVTFLLQTCYKLVTNLLQPCYKLVANLLKIATFRSCSASRNFFYGTPIFFCIFHLVGFEIRLFTENQLPRLSGRSVIFKKNFGWHPNFLLHISSSWVKIRLHTEIQLPRLSRSDLKVCVGGWGGVGGVGWVGWVTYQ
jgi:hypothetical protein